MCSRVDGKRGSSVCSLAKVHLSMILVVKTLLVHVYGSPMSPYIPMYSIRSCPTVEGLLVHTSVFLHTMCASLCLRSALFLIQHSTTGIIILSLNLFPEGMFWPMRVLET